MAGETEEKKLPPSQRKLKKAREKGQVANSIDFVNALTLIAGVIVVTISWPRYVELFTGSFRLALDAGTGTASGEAARAVTGIIKLIAQTMAPLLIVVAATGFIAHIVHKKGLIFSIHPIIPDFTRINPAQGFTRIFSAKNFAEFGIALLRCLIWFVTAGFIVWFAMSEILTSSSCALPCVTTTGYELIRKLVVVALVIILAVSILDLPFQIFMFIKEQRMSLTEFKHEMKEMQGAPEFVGYRREQHREMASGGGVGKGSGNATIVFVSSGEAVAIRYDADSQPIPIVVAKGRGVHADPILKAAEQLGTPIEADPRLAIELSRVGIGGMVPEREFKAVALAMVRHGKARAKQG